MSIFMTNMEENDSIYQSVTIKCSVNITCLVQADVLKVSHFSHQENIKCLFSNKVFAVQQSLLISLLFFP